MSGGYQGQGLARNQFAGMSIHDTAMAQGAAVGYGANQEARRLEVPWGVERIESNLGALSATVDALDCRLTGYVARSHPPANETAGQIKGAPSTGLGGQLDMIAERIDHLARRAQDLLDRLET